MPDSHFRVHSLLLDKLFHHHGRLLQKGCSKFRYLVYRTAKEVERRFKQRLGNLRKLMRKKHAIEAKIERLVDAIESGVGIEELRERLARRKQEKKELEARIKAIKEGDIEEKYAQTVLDAVWRLLGALDEKPPEMLHGELRRHIEAIRVYGDGRVELVTSLKGVFEGSVFGLEIRGDRLGAARNTQVAQWLYQRVRLNAIA